MSNSKKNKPKIMGILNVTPDSFSDGGKFDSLDAAISQGKKMIDEGADIIDIGGESTRPGSKRVSSNEQRERVIHIIKAICETKPKNIQISIDTTLSDVAEAALNSGAEIVNDVSAGNDDPEILRLCAERQCPYIVMHMQGIPETMQNNPMYKDVVSEVLSFLKSRSEECLKVGIDKDNIIIDPGIGFGKTSEHNLLLLNNLNVFVNSGYSVLLGASRKRFMGEICNVERPVELVGATTASTVLGVLAGVEIFRVHDVMPNRQAADTAWTILEK